MSRPVYGIKFPLVKERTKFRRGPRFRLVVDKTGLWGARACAAGMVNSAMSYRDSALRQARDGSAAADRHRISRLHMRTMALWARIFAGQIDQADPRVEAASQEASAICRRMNAEVEAFLAAS